MRTPALRTLEAVAQARLGDGVLMARAGAAAARIALEMGRDRAAPFLVLAGPGNNGGDALVLASALRERGVECRVALLGDPGRYRGDALGAWQRWDAARGPDDLVDDARPGLGDAPLVIDGLFGIGISRPPDERAAGWIDAVNASACPVLALDVPSGLDADTGRVLGTAIRADRTITFIADKPGLHTGDGPDHAGEVVVDTLGVDDAVADDEAIGAFNRPTLFAHALRPRAKNSHKGSFGSVAVIGGHDGMVGAALLAARMALHAGAGRVYVKLAGRQGPGHDVVHPELMFRDRLDGIDVNAVAIGSGLGQDTAALTLLKTWIETPQSLAIDADALNAIAVDPELGLALVGRRAAGHPVAVLTPHPLEAARLLGVDTKTVQADRIGSARELAASLDSVVVLKGAGTVITDPHGAWVINPTGNPGLATGGTGDVLCGLVAALLAQRLSPIDAARAAVWMHGQAADDLVAEGIGPVGLTASELIPAIRRVLNR